MDAGKLIKFIPQQYLGAASGAATDKRIRFAIKIALVMGLDIGVLYLPVLSFSGQGGQSLSDVFWYAVVGGADRSYWLSVAPAHYIGAIGTLLALFIALAAHIAGVALSDHLRTFGGGLVAAICLIALLPLVRPLATGILDAMAYGLPIAILYLIAVMGWEGYDALRGQRGAEPVVEPLTADAYRGVEE